MLKLVFVFIMSTAFFIPGYSDTLNVPSEYPTIMNAIIAGSTGDTVLVAPGVYVENIRFFGREVTVKSSHGPMITVIDGNDKGPVVVFNDNEDASSVLDGFTLTNGFSSDNYFYKSGAGVYCGNNASPVISNNIIKDNQAINDGGGIYCRYGTFPTLINNLFTNNIANKRGGAIFIQSTSPSILNCTIIDNAASSSAPGIFCYGVLSTPDIRNTIVWEGSSNAIVTDEGATPIITYSDIQFGWPGVGNIDSDPSFIRPYRSVSKLGDDFRLKQDPCQEGVTNACVDGGDPASSMITGTTRTDGAQDTGIVDMGFHYPLPRVLEAPSEYSTIQEAIQMASLGDTIIVDPGTYVENINFLGKAVLLKSSGGPGFTFINGNRNGSVVTFQNLESEYAVLEGFTLTNGYADNGGGIFCYTVSGTSGGETRPVIRNNIITNNEAINYGGGISCQQRGAPLITQNTITGNTAATYGGGGVYVGGDNTDVTLEKNVIHNNSAGTGGGGIYCQFYASIYLTDNVIVENTAINNGGGVYCSNDAYASLLNNLIHGNDTGDWGGGINISSNSTGYFRNNTVTMNSAGIGGGGLYWTPNGIASIWNSIFWGNTAPGGSQVAQLNGVRIYYCDVQDGWGGLGSNNIDSDPLFTIGPNGDHYLSQIASGQISDSPCVDGGDPSSDMISGTTRTDEEQDQGVVDMGFHYTQAPQGATAVELVSFLVVGNKRQAHVIWETGSELECAGFHIWRKNGKPFEKGVFTRITSQIIPSKGGPSQGSEYSYFDPKITFGRPYSYFLEEIDYNGKSTKFRPVDLKYKRD